MNKRGFEPAHGGRYLSAVRFAQVQSELRARARRLKFLPGELLADPAWDILLHAYSFEIVQRRVTEAELAERINFPSTTAMRWMKILEAEGLVDRKIDAAASGQALVGLTVKGVELMDGYFSEAPSD